MRHGLQRYKPVSVYFITDASLFVVFEHVAAVSNVCYFLLSN